MAAARVQISVGQEGRSEWTRCRDAVRLPDGTGKTAQYGRLFSRKRAPMERAAGPDRP